MVRLLGSDLIGDRDNAMEELRDCEEHLPVLEKEFKKTDDPEIRWRLEKILQELWIRPLVGEYIQIANKTGTTNEDAKATLKVGPQKFVWDQIYSNCRTTQTYSFHISSISADRKKYIIPVIFENMTTDTAYSPESVNTVLTFEKIDRRWKVTFKYTDEQEHSGTAFFNSKPTKGPPRNK